MDVLQLCAQNYVRLCEYAYDCTIARRNTSTELRFTFSPYEFRHLAGLHRLENPRLRSNSERILKEILAGKITLETLRCSANWVEEQDKILLRLEALSQLDLLMDEFLLIFGFSGEKLALTKPPIRTKIEADYLIKFQLKNGMTFFFSVQHRDTYCGRSIFVNNTRDYSIGQTRFTLLEKKKVHLPTGEATLLYRRESFKK